MLMEETDEAKSCPSSDDNVIPRRSFDMDTSYMHLYRPLICHHCRLLLLSRSANRSLEEPSRTECTVQCMCRSIEELCDWSKASTSSVAWNGNTEALEDFCKPGRVAFAKAVKVLAWEFVHAEANAAKFWHSIRQHHKAGTDSNRGSGGQGRHCEGAHRKAECPSPRGRREFPKVDCRLGDTAQAARG